MYVKLYIHARNEVTFKRYLDIFSYILYKSNLLERETSFLASTRSHYPILYNYYSISSNFFNLIHRGNT